MNVTFGEYTRNLRLENELILTELAALLKLDSSNLSKNEKNFYGNRLEKLASSLTLEFDKLKIEFFSYQF